MDNNEENIRQTSRPNAGTRTHARFTPAGYDQGQGRGSYATPPGTRPPPGFSQSPGSTSGFSAASQNRRRLEIELEAEKVKAEAAIRVAEIERKLRHAEVDEQEEQNLSGGSDDEFGDSHDVQDWMQRSDGATGNADANDASGANPVSVDQIPNAAVHQSTTPTTHPVTQSEQPQIPISSLPPFTFSFNRYGPQNQFGTQAGPTTSTPFTQAGTAASTAHQSKGFFGNQRGSGFTTPFFNPYTTRGTYANPAPSTSYYPGQNSAAQNFATRNSATQNFATQNFGTQNHGAGQHGGSYSHSSRPPPHSNQDVMLAMVETLQKLKPPRDLPKFTGEIEDWGRFITDFQQSTQERRISNVDNLNRLQKSLSGKAMDAVRALFTHPDNVPQIIETLRLRFGRPELIIKSIIEKIRAYKKIRDDQLDLVVEFSCQVRNLVTTIESMNRPAHLHNPLLLEELQEKLPSNLKLQWAMYNMNWQGEITVRDFADFIHEQAQGLLLFTKVNATPIVEKKDEKRKSKGSPSVIATTSTEGKAEEKAKPKSKCNFCGKDEHRSYQCPDFNQKTVDERRVIVKDKHLCYNCMGRHPGGVKECKSRGCRKCEKKHHTLLHIETESDTAVETKPEVQATIACAVEDKRKLVQIFSQIIPVTLYGPQEKMDTFAFLDSGAQCTLIDEDTASKLGFYLEKTSMPLVWINGAPQNIQVAHISLKIRGKNQKKEYWMPRVKTFKGLQMPTQTISPEQVKSWGYSDVNLSTYEDARPTIVIGADNAHLFSMDQDAEMKRPYLSKTKLGWTVFGPVISEESRAVFTTAELKEIKVTIPNLPVATPELKFVGLIQEQENDLHNLVKSFFSTEEFGVKASAPLVSSDDKRAMEILEKTTRRVEEGWETGLLWKQDLPVLPDSYPTALRRLKAIERKMDQNPEFANQYHSKIMELIEKGYAQELLPKEQKYEGRKWYLPHFNVHNPKKPSKFRIVFDAKAKSEGRSLNSFLLTGPDFYQPLPDVLVKFRQHAYGFMGDIEDMFLKIKMKKEDCHCQRFLYRGMERNAEPKVYLLTRVIFGGTCSPCSAHYVKNKNAEEFKDEFPKSAEVIEKNHFVDDYFDSCSDVDSSMERIQEVSEIHRRGGFKIRGWIASDSKILEAVDPTLHAPAKMIGFNGIENTERVLGLYWKPESDSFTFNAQFVRVDDKILRGEKRPTKREMLRLVMSIFDPMGFIAPFLVKAKIILQDTWRSGIGWDDEIPTHLMEVWLIWIQELHLLSSISIPRCYEKEVASVENIQLHIFVDASSQAFAAVGYFRFQFRDRVSVAFVMAKTRVAPLRPMTIPKLELQAAVMGSRLAEAIKRSHDFKIQETVFWSDSTTVLDWLNSEARRFNVFVANRIGELQEATSGDSWRWIPTSENVSDDATRHIGLCEFDSNGRWFTGPPFLKLHSDLWPRREKHSKKAEEEEANLVALVQNLRSPIGFERFSSFERLVRGWAYVRRLRMLKANRPANKTLLLKEIKEAENSLFRAAQKESFPLELKLLQKGKEIHKGSRLEKLSPYLYTDGLIRVRGRTERSVDLDEDSQHPIILAPGHAITKLLLGWYHRKFHHQGQETCLNEVRQRFWIINARTAMRSAFNDCKRCQVTRPIPIKQEMGILPTARVTRQLRPFTEVGLDYFGPMEVTVGRRHEKRWGALFTCLATRAVHIEVAHSLNTDSAIMALRRMIARRGTPTRIFSDNGTNFHGANGELKRAFQEIDQEKLEAKATHLGIQWSFNPPVSPHMGGAWESLVKSVKIALKSTLKERFPKDEVLHTLLLEAEHVVNSRPLTYVSSDLNDTEALTPNHFLLGRSSGVQVPGKFEKADLCLRKQWREAQALADIFWQRWVKEYLPTLNKRTKWTRPGHQLQVGDFVLVADGNFIRGSWPKGEIVAVYPSKIDNQVRVVDVKTPTGVYRRSVQKLLVPASTGEIDPKVNLGGDMSSGDLAPVGH